METRLADVKDFEELSISLGAAKDIITKDYLYQLEKYEVRRVPRELRKLEIAEFTRLYRFRKFVTDKNENTMDKLVTVLNAAYTSHATVVALIQGNEECTEYYLGVVSKDQDQISCDIGTQGETFRRSLTGNFPGLELDPVTAGDTERLCDQIFTYDCITSISGIASLRNDKEHNFEKYVQGIEHLVDSLQGREYSVIVIADPVDANEIALAKSGYENLYTQLSPFAKTSLSFNETDSISVTQSHTDGVTESLGESMSMTQNYSKTNGWSESSSHGTSSNKDMGGLVGSLSGAAIGAGAVVVTGGLAAPAVAAAAFAGSQIGHSVGAGMMGSSGRNTTQSSSESGSYSESSGSTASRNSSVAMQDSFTKGQSESASHGRNLQFSNENKAVKNLLGRIDRHLERLEKCEAYGAFNCATYVISSDPETNAIASNGYNALMRGDNSALQASYINTWSKESRDVSKVKEYLERFSHPLFVKDEEFDIVVSPASLANSYEMAVNLGIPKKSINGLPVFEMASFGRNVLRMSGALTSRKKIHLGEIWHMGVKERASVDLDVKSLAMHTFITGSTGSGKSNTVYQILRELKRQNVHFLVIEPAKGEYKHIFGNDGANVYGTNPYCTPLLKINPFRFPNGMHVLEHIDRLIEIFNVCWPMYAAMPAVLKDSVERAYVSAGWDLSSSVNVYDDGLFPTFADVLTELEKVIDGSAFSQEVKDNYIGSLSTRIKSLTNGIYGRIFCNGELGDAALFDEDVIIDLSRVGSVETKSMIMGILVMRLQEYRMTSGDMNADLRHITVLEEAHNLLKRTSTEQSGESANLLGKSVEMLSNAIAEVRTYGEGFIIADQAPGLLDMSVIRNTNTKIVLRLPDAQDRELVGKSANLTDAQIRELAKIPTGVAAVYQNNWLEPALCQVAYESADGAYCMENPSAEFLDNGKKVILGSLLDKVAGERLDMNMAELTRRIVASVLPTNVKTAALGLIKRNGKVTLSEIAPVIYDAVVSPGLEEEAQEAESIEEWKDVFLGAEGASLSEFNENEQNVIVECILREQVARYDKPDEYLETWQKYIRGEVM